MVPRLRHILVLSAGLLVVGTGCQQSAGQAPGPSADVITREQIQARHFLTAYEAVSALHANWLLERGTNSLKSPGLVQVYVDNNQLGGVDELQNIAVESIVYIRYYDAVAATARWGVGHTQGVIYISTAQ
ncbi:MAG TPA: hypothetical protein VIJ16_01510 [Gemmatimonadaceae bacterium]